MVAKKFPAPHPKAGIETNFNLKIQNHIKIHTIRNNYEYWKKRIENIKAGKAFLSLREWNGKAYQSNQFELMKLYKTDIQKIIFDGNNWKVNNKNIDIVTLSTKDGLAPCDFDDWFNKPKINDPYALIHFSNFRYE